MHKGVEVVLEQKSPVLVAKALVRLAFEERSGNNVNTEMKLPEHILMAAQVYASLAVAEQINYLTSQGRR